MIRNKTVRAELVEAQVRVMSPSAKRHSRPLRTGFEKPVLSIAEKLSANGAAVLALLLTACGSAAELQPAPGRSLPVAPIGARATPPPDELLTATTQQRPERSAELLRRSEERRGDEFDLPPE